jgi:hypothetical protein
MIVFILVLILLAILFSTDRGRVLLEEIFLLPFRIIGSPFRFAREEKERLENNQSRKDNLERKEEIRKLFSEKQFEMLNKEKFNSEWSFSNREMLDQVRFFEGILEGGQDPRILNLNEKFSFIQVHLFEKAKKDFIDSQTNFTPQIIQYIRKYRREASLDSEIDYEELKQKLGVTPVIGKQSKERIISALKGSAQFEGQVIEEMVDFILENIK